MSFLHPVLFLAFPVIALPVLIHLLNKRRHQPHRWAAFAFLREATREHQGRRRLRHWLILAMRTLTLLGLLLAAAKPLVGGLLGAWLGSETKTVIVLLDRSASMERQLPGSQESKRGYVLRRFRETGIRERSARVQVIDSALLEPSMVEWRTLDDLTATDTAASVPELLSRGIDALGDRHVGTVEIWLGTDAQRQAWAAESDTWRELRERWEALGTKPLLRVLTLEGGNPNASIAVTEAVLHPGDEASAPLLLRGQVSGEFTNPLRAELSLNGQVSEQLLRVDETTGGFAVELPPVAIGDGGWGKVRLPIDGNARDNTAYFAYEPAGRTRAVIVSENEALGRLLAFACAPMDGAEPSSRLLSAAACDPEILDEAYLLIWQSSDLPDMEFSDAVASFLERGGQVLVLPSGLARESTAFSVHFAPPIQRETPFTLAPWRRDEGPLADAGQALAVDQLGVRQRCQVSLRNGVAWASFADGEALLLGAPRGKGDVWAMSTLPLAAWSSLGEGFVLVPMLQRLLQRGQTPLGQVGWLDCNRNALASVGEDLVSMEPAEGAAGLVAGVYGDEKRFRILRRPRAEDSSVEVDSATREALLTGIPWRPFDSVAEGAEISESRLRNFWHPFLVLMLVAFVLEGFLALPKSRFVKRESPQTV